MREARISTTTKQLSILAEDLNKLDRMERRQKTVQTDRWQHARGRRLRWPFIRNLLRFFLLISDVASTSILTSTSPHTSYIDTHADSFGAVVEGKGKVFIIKDILTIQINISALSTYPEKFQDIRRNIRNIMRTETLADTDKDNLIQFQHMLDTLGNPVSRSKRSLIPVGGDILHSLFGTATDSQLQEYKNNIIALQKWAKSKGKLLHKSISTINSHSELMKSFANKLNNVVSNITRSLRETDTALNARVDVQSILTLGSMIINRFHSLLTALTLASRGIVSSSLLQPVELATFIDFAIRKYNYIPIVPVTDIDFYYPLLKSYVLGHDVFISIPFASRRQYSAFIIKPFPGFINNTIVQLDIEETLVFISSTLDFISFPTSAMFNDLCYSTSAFTHICSNIGVHLFPAHLFPCIRSTLVSGKTTNSNCKFIKTKVNHPQVLHSGNIYHLFFPKSTQISISCMNQSTKLHDVLGSYVVPDSCGISSPGVQIPPSSHHFVKMPVVNVNYTILRKPPPSHLQFNESNILGERFTVPPPIDDDYSVDDASTFYWAPSSAVLSHVALPVLILVLVVVGTCYFRKMINARVTGIIESVRSTTEEP